MKRNETPRSRLADITYNLRHGDMKQIASMAHCSCSTVSKVLNGLCSQTTDNAMNIIRIAEEFARRNSMWRRKK